tara:strand:- start:837 stop:1016 length:180 start_codon:yes stop_codon:yes gene_type:complete
MRKKRGCFKMGAPMLTKMLKGGSKAKQQDKPGPPRCWKGYMPNPDGRPASEQGSCVEKK